MAGKFPGPYINDTKVDNSVMEYVPFDKTDIGARSSGMPKEGMRDGTKSIQHVENRKTGG